MIHGRYVADHPLNVRDLIFKAPSAQYDYSLNSIQALHKSLLSKGYMLHTQDYSGPIGFEFHENVREFRRRVGVAYFSYAAETKYFFPRNYDEKLISEYDIVFHYDPSFVHSRTKIKDLVLYTEPRHWCKDLGRIAQSNIFRNRHIDVVCIASNKNIKLIDPFNGYNKRVEYIKFFSEQNLVNFKLYGSGWDLPAKREGYVGHLWWSLLQRVQHRSKLIGNLIVRMNDRPYWGGTIPVKRDVLQNAKFTLAFENSLFTPGWVTEKLFDALCNGSVPIVFGVPRINGLEVPRYIYIDAAEYSPRQLLSKIASFTESAYCTWWEKAKVFIKTLDDTPICADSFGNIVASAITDKIGSGVRVKT